MFPPGERKFLLISRISIIALFALILAGGVVRSSGSGMGCPDWPKCFDRYVPPVSESQLPAGYKEKYVEKRVRKNERFAKTLDAMGYGDIAFRIRNDKSILTPEAFNAAKTWTEYINRLIGALTGFFLLGCAVFSRIYVKTKNRIFFLSLFNILLVVFQAWLGSIVVSTNLLAWVVTVHMLAAFAIIAISIYTFFEARMLHNRGLMAQKQSAGIKWLAALALLLSLFQVIAGTEVREMIDYVASSTSLGRSEWVAQAGTIFNVHRDSALAVTLVTVILFMMVRKRFRTGSEPFKYATYSVILLLAQVATGVVLAYFGLPGVAQAVHILLAVLLFSAQFYLFLLLKKNTVYAV